MWTDRFTYPVHSRYIQIRAVAYNETLHHDSMWDQYGLTCSTSRVMRRRSHANSTSARGKETALSNREKKNGGRFEG